MARTHYLRNKRTGGFAGSIGTGKSVVPTSAPKASVPVVTVESRVEALRSSGVWYETPSNMEILVDAQDYFKSPQASRVERRNFRKASRAKNTAQRLKLAVGIPALGEPTDFENPIEFDGDGRHAATAWGLINNPNIQPDELYILTHVGKDVDGLNNLLAGNRVMTEASLLEIANTSDRIVEANNGGAELKTHGADDPLYVLAQRPYLPLSVQQSLAVKRDPKIRELLARNPSAAKQFRHPAVHGV